jgi:hypothetical protein
MAGTFYGYAERNADSYTDWREVGQYATDMIDETIKVRQEKKDALDKATRDALKQISNTPIGAHASARKAALEMADTVSKNLLIQEKLMKSGKLDPKDYLIYNQNALDGIDLAFNANKAYQENYQKIMDGVNSGDMSGLTLLNAAKAEEYGDWNNMGWQMSPEGTLMVGLKTEKDINGQKVNSLDKITSVNALNGLLLNTIPKNKLEDQINKWVPTLGKNQIAVIQKAGYGKQGMVITKEDITKRTDLSADEKTILFQFVEAEKLKVASLLGPPTNIASILFDTKRTTDSGVDYSPTDNANEAAKDPSKILRIYNQSTGGYEFQVSDKQRAEAEKFAFNRMREQYDIIEKVDVGGQIQDQSAEWKYRAGQTAKKEKEFAKNLAQNLVYSMTSSQEKAAPATKYLSAVTGSLFDKKPNGYEVTTKTGKQFYEFAPNGKLADPVGFSKSIIGSIKSNLPDEYKNVSEENILKYVQEFLPKGSKINLTTSAQGFVPRPKKQTAVEQFSSYIDTSMSTPFKKGATKEQVLSSLNGKLQGTGFEAKKSIMGYIYLEDADGNESPAYKIEDINYGLPKLAKWMKGNLPAKTVEGVKDKEAAAAELIESGVISSGGGEVQNRIGSY